MMMMNRNMMTLPTQHEELRSQLQMTDENETDKPTYEELASALRALRLEAIHYRTNHIGGLFLDRELERVTALLIRTNNKVLATY